MPPIPGFGMGENGRDPGIAIPSSLLLLQEPRFQNGTGKFS